MYQVKTHAIFGTKYEVIAIAQAYPMADKPRRIGKNVWMIEVQDIIEEPRTINKSTIYYLLS